MANNQIKYHCQLHLELSPLPLVMIYPGKLNQVFMNLIINAGQSIEDNGEITIRSMIKDANVVIDIEDTGLGLSISHGIIEQHGGEIKGRSTVGRGSCYSDGAEHLRTGLMTTV